MSAREGRLHAAHKLALVTELPGQRFAVASPAPGWFRPAVATGQLVDTGRHSASVGVLVGQLDVLGKSYQLLAPRGAGLVCLSERLAGRAHLAVSAGETLLTLDAAAALTGAAASATGAEPTAAMGLVLRAPSSGRFYTRPSPQKPPFFAVGDILEQGHTVCLLEVMKTFHRVTYGDPALPERAKVIAVLAQEESDVTAGQPLLEVEPA